MNYSTQTSIRTILLKTTVVHTLSYFLMGIIAMNLFHYAEMFHQPPFDVYMRTTDDPLVMLGIVFQPLRGILFGIVFYLFQEVIFARRNGWLTAWLMLVFVGIFSTFAPAPGSIEGLIYTKLTAGQQWGGILEVLMQSLLLAWGTFYWVRNPEKRWINWVLGIGFVVVMLFPLLGLLAQSVHLSGLLCQHTG